MDGSDLTSDLQRYLQGGREALLWKLEGLSAYDIRRPMVPTGTDLLGLVKHAATMEAGYFGVVFDRPFDGPLVWMDEDAEPNAWWADHRERLERVARDDAQTLRGAGPTER